MPDVFVYADGGARGNPGPAAIGVVVCSAANRVLKEHRECFGIGTNNEAEYRALIKGLELAAAHTKGEVACVLDSELVVRQMTGAYRVRDERMAALHRQALAAAARFAKVTYEQRPRLTGRLERADELVNWALDEAEADYRATGMGWPHEPSAPERKR